MQLAITNQSPHPLPTYATAGASGMDLRAYLTQNQTIQPLQRQLIGTGLTIMLPKGFEAQVRPRSGLALQHGITVLNSPGTIDADYRGELKVLLINLSDTAFVVEDGMRIAQLVVAQHATITWHLVPHLADTERGAGGYGSTGIY